MGMNSAPNPSPMIATRIGFSLAIDDFLTSSKVTRRGLRSFVQDSRTGASRQAPAEETTMATTGDRPVGVAFIGTGAVTAYHHLPGLRLDPRAELVAICDADPGPARAAQGGVGRRGRLDRPRGDLPAGRRGRRRDRHAQRHAPADRRGRGPGGQARHVREAARALGRRGARDVRGRPRRRRRPHDGVHLPLRARRCGTCGTCSSRARWARRGISARSGSSTGPRRAGDGGSIAPAPARATSST